MAGCAAAAAATAAAAAAAAAADDDGDDVARESIPSARERSERGRTIA